MAEAKDGCVEPAKGPMIESESKVGYMPGSKRMLINLRKKIPIT